MTPRVTLRNIAPVAVFFLFALASVAHATGPISSSVSVTNISSEPSVTGETYSVSFAAVGSDSGIPTGTVAIKIDGDPIPACSGILDGSGNGSCSVNSNGAMAPGSHSIIAYYGGDGTYASSDSSATPTSHGVNKADTTLSITSDLSAPTLAGQSYAVGWSALITSPGSGTLTGTVTVSDGTNSCSAAVGTGTCTLASVSAGNKTITASYYG